MKFLIYRFREETCGKVSWRRESLFVEIIGFSGLFQMSVINEYFDFCDEVYRIRKYFYYWFKRSSFTWYHVPSVLVRSEKGMW